MAILTINGTALPDPISYSAPMSDMEAGDSAYSESGVRIRNRIRQDIVRLEAAWRVDDAGAAALLAAAGSSGKLEVTYLDPRTGANNTADMYVEDRSCSLVLHRDHEGSADNLWDISFSLVQY